MNKKQLNKLDPKLKEKYERIMSTPTQPGKKKEAAIKTQSKQETKTMKKEVTFKATPPPKIDSDKKSSALTYILIALGVLFFAGYSIFWLKFFNIPLPF